MPKCHIYEYDIIWQWSFIIYPNPVKNYLTLTNSVSKNEKSHITVKNILGEIVFDKEISDQEIQISFNNFNDKNNCTGKFCNYKDIG